MRTKQFLLVLLVAILISGCVESHESVIQTSGNPSKELPASFFSSSTNLLVSVPEASTKVLNISLSEKTSDFIFLGVKAISSSDVTGGIGVDIPLRDYVEYHPFALPGDNQTWATRAFGSVSGENRERAKSLIFLSAGTSPAIFEIGLVAPEAYALRWKAAETMNGRPTTPIVGNEYSVNIQAGSHWFITDEADEQQWQAGDIAFSVQSEIQGSRINWEMDFPGPKALETLYHIGVGAALIQTSFNHEQKEDAFTFLQTDAGIVPAFLSNYVPGYGSGSEHFQCLNCKSNRMAGNLLFVGDEKPTEDSVTVIIVSGGQIPEFGWNDFGWTKTLQQN